jgi:dihydrodipicolinate synthase/N-acetylneuraminate lyase
MNVYLDPTIKTLLHDGTIIPAHPLALTPDRRLDEERQRRLTRYYLAAGVGGIAVGVHTTQFSIRKPEINLYETVLRLAAEEVAQVEPHRTIIKVAGIVGPTQQAIKEANLALKYGYDLGLLSLGGLKDLTEPQLIDHVRQVAETIPVFGFYLQPAVGGRVLSYRFWRSFAEIENVHAIKIAAFNRYQTIDVVRAVCESSRAHDIALYTGNDDNIVADLLTAYRFEVGGKTIEKRFVGGLLGHWAVWTRKAVELLATVKNDLVNNTAALGNLLATGIAVTDMNAAIFDAPNSFHGCIPGIHEVLRRQGLLEGRWCLDPEEQLSPGQMEEIDRVNERYPSLIDDAFVQTFLEAEKQRSTEKTA